MEGLKKFRSIIDKFLEIVCAFLFGAVCFCTGLWQTGPYENGIYRG